MQYAVANRDRSEKLTDAMTKTMEVRHNAEKLQKLRKLGSLDALHQ